MGNAGAKPTLTQVIEISGEDVAGVIQSTIVARMQALPDFLSEDAADTRRRGGNYGTDAAKTQDETVESHIVLGRGFSDFLVFRLTYEGPASTTVCAGSA